MTDISTGRFILSCWLWLACSSFLPSCSAVYAKLLLTQGKLVRRWDTKNLSHPTPGARPDESHCTVWGGNLFRRFCNMFSESYPCSLGQHGNCTAAQQPGELSQNILQNLLNKLPPQTVHFRLRFCNIHTVHPLPGLRHRRGHDEAAHRLQPRAQLGRIHELLPGISVGVRVIHHDAPEGVRGEIWISCSFYLRRSQQVNRRCISSSDKFLIRAVEPRKA